MTAYVVIDLEVSDADGFQQYVDGVTPLIREMGGHTLAVDSSVTVLEGDWSPSSLVLHAFPDQPAVQRFWNSSEYAPFKHLRRKYSTVKVIVVEGE